MRPEGVYGALVLHVADALHRGHPAQLLHVRTRGRSHGPALALVQHQLAGQLRRMLVVVGRVHVPCRQPRRAWLSPMRQDASKSFILPELLDTTCCCHDPAAHNQHQLTRQFGHMQVFVGGVQVPLTLYDDRATCILTSVQKFLTHIMNKSHLLWA